ncbi:helix-turn-helix domain-containing protein [Aquabacterium sp. OR-4]|uniref:helix-turn-helix domain-containing protein n=1 Tax=Aquabacterium sp. OR-4 TaxID=2978127 RepID=UPI0021B1BC02|nr:GAF domain-containing protein [Aquabacterium sp. OR-4]MDT7835074.1 GAF domain-containing protein [Aquabacterium sp. OR-4]
MESAEQIAADLVDLLHQGALADEFGARLLAAEALPGSNSKTALIERVRMAMAVRNRLELLQQREQGLLAIVESAQDLSSRLDLDELLRTIVRRARALLGGDMAWLSILDGAQGVFRVVVAEGSLAPGTAAMVVGRERGVVSVVMSTRQAFTTPDYLHDRRFTHDVGLDSVFRDEGIVALAGVPLIWADEVIGLLFVADRYPRVHTAHNLAILSTLATHAAVALKNARDFGRVQAALCQADAARAALEQHARDVQAAADAHEEMTSLLARGASLATLCQSVAQRLGGSVLVLDEAAQVLSRGTAEGYGGSGAARYAPHDQRSAAMAEALRQARRIGRSVPAYQDDGEHCRVMPVIGGDGMLGALALFHAGALSELAVRTLERSSSVVGIVLLSQERREAAQSRDTAALLRALLSPRQDDLAAMADRAAHLGLDLGQPLSLLLLELDAPGSAYAARRLRPMGALERCLVEDIDGLLVVLCGAPRADGVRQAVAGWARREAGAGHRGVFSRPMSNPAALPGVFATLRRSLGVLQRLGVQGQVVGQNELALYSTLFETQDPSSLDQFLHATIGPLLEHDRKRRSGLADTLLCYFDCNQNAKTTAQRLNIHANTVRQRLATVEDLLGHWGQAMRALEIHIALRLWSLRTEPVAPGHTGHTSPV